jgi:GNAT superfamily N-acetyltransferase
VLEIRQVGAESALMVRDLRLRALAGDPASFGSSLAREQAYTDDRWREWVTGPNVSPLFASFVAFLDGSTVGLVLSCRNEQQPDQFHVLAMWVAPQARRQGVGRALLGRAEGWAAEHGARSTILGVTTVADAARGLYEGAGYTPTGATRPLDHLPGVIEVELAKQLAPADGNRPPSTPV